MRKYSSNPISSERVPEALSFWVSGATSSSEIGVRGVLKLWLRVSFDISSPNPCKLVTWAGVLIYLLWEESLLTHKAAFSSRYRCPKACSRSCSPLAWPAQTFHVIMKRWWQSNSLHWPAVTRPASCPILHLDDFHMEENSVLEPCLLCQKRRL